MIKEFTIGVSHTLNLGSYNSLRVEASITVAVPETAANSEAAMNALKGKAQIDLRTLLRETYNQQKTSPAEQRK